MRKALKILFNIIIPVAVGYTVFGVLLSMFTKIPEVGQIVQNAWFIPFGILSLYMGYIIAKDSPVTQSH